MGGKGECPCCKQWKDLTEHHVKEAGNQVVMICLDCHRRIDEYLKLVKKLRS